MKRILVFTFWFGLLSGGRLSADVVTLKGGRQISGSVESGNTQELHIKVGDQSQTVDIHQGQAIQFGVSLPAPAVAPPPPQVAGIAPEAVQVAGQADTLILKDGTHVTGRWWSVDASQVHFLVDNQLRHYPRPDVAAVTFGDAALPTLPSAPSTPPPATPAPPPASAVPPANTPALARPSAGPPPQPPTLTRPSGSAPPSPQRGVSQPEQLGMVYFWNGKALIPLERNQAVERGSGSAQYWEMPAPQSRVRLSEASTLVFVLRLPKRVDPASYGLFPLATANGSRRTQSEAGRRGGLMTWPFKIDINDASSLMTYALTVRDLPAGEYSFSPSNSNDSYCFGVDPSAPGQ